MHGIGLALSELSFLICKVGLMAAPTSQAVRWIKVFSKMPMTQRQMPSVLVWEEGLRSPFSGSELTLQPVLCQPRGDIWRGAGEAEPL